MKGWLHDVEMEQCEHRSPPALHMGERRGCAVHVCWEEVLNEKKCLKRRSGNT